MNGESLVLSPLGKKSSYISQYQRDLLHPIPRQMNRDDIHVHAPLPFKGIDIWNAYEISWLNAKGKPVVAIGEFIFPCTSSFLIESKSFKLYLNSFTNTRFDSLADVKNILQRDLSEFSGADVTANVVLLKDFSDMQMEKLSGVCIDDLDITCDKYLVEPAFLQTGADVVTEKLYSDLLKSNCLVTGQPDWASVSIHYTGKKISHEGLLRYLVSLRDHNEFHEQCVERIFVDIMRHCKPEKLTVYARYTRRGGLDINPFRSTEKEFPEETGRLARQ